MKDTRVPAFLTAQAVPPCEHFTHSSHLSDPSISQAIHLQVGGFLPIESRQLWCSPITSPLPPYQPGMFRLALSSRSLHSTCRKCTAGIVLPRNSDFFKPICLLSLTESCQNVQTLVITSSCALTGISFALSRGACQHLTQLHILPEGGSDGWSWDLLSFLALALEAGALPRLEVLSVGFTLPDKPFGRLLESLKEGRVSPLFREMHFGFIAEENLPILARVLQARAITAAEGLARLEGTWTASTARNVQAVKRIARLIIPTLKEVPLTIERDAKLFSECMKQTPALSIRRVHTEQPMNAKWLLDALSNGAAPNVEEISFPSLDLDSDVLESWRRGKENNAWRKIRSLRLGLRNSSLETATPFVELLSGAQRNGYADNDREGAEEGREVLVSAGGNAAGGEAGGGNCSDGSDAFFSEIRSLHLEAGASFGGGSCGGAIWSAMVRRACPRLEVAEARLTCEALTEVTLSLGSPVAKGDCAANAAAGDTAPPLSPPLLLPSSITAAASSLAFSLAVEEPSPSSITAGPASSSLSPRLRAVKCLHFTGGKLTHAALETFAAAVQKGALPFFLKSCI